MDIIKLLTYTVETKASDLHLSSGSPPILRIDGDLKPVSATALGRDELMEMLKQIMTEEQHKMIVQNLELDFAYALKDLARFRINIFFHDRGVAAAFRPLYSKIPTMDALGFPDTLKKLCELPNGLVLVTGPTGSGKSTTLASMIDFINQRSAEHIITIEDPIEYEYRNKNSLIQQREVGRDTKSFNNALRSALREDPDILLVGEMRDLETIRLALTAAETGHLVFSTLHTADAAKSVQRVVDVFPGEEKTLVQTMFANSLQAVVSQTLIKRKGGGRIAAQEILICTPAVRTLIRENKVNQIPSAIQTGSSYGMRSMEQHLAELKTKGIID